jgi:hypothetical protein
VANSGNFVETTPLLWSKTNSPFEGFMKWSEWLFGRIGRQHSIALNSLAEFLFQFLTEELRLEKPHVAKIIWSDWQRGGRHEKPNFLNDFIPNEEVKLARDRHFAPKRQSRHLVTHPTS